MYESCSILKPDRERKRDKHPQCDLFFSLFVSNQSKLTLNTIMVQRMLQKIHISAAPLCYFACYMFHLSAISQIDSLLEPKGPQFSEGKKKEAHPSPHIKTYFLQYP